MIGWPLGEALSRQYFKEGTMSVDAKNKPKTVFYKKAKTPANITLQAAIDSALSSKKLVKSRWQTVGGDDSGVHRFVNYHTKDKNITYGELVMFETGRSQQAIAIEDKERLDISAFKPPKKDGKTLEFIESVLYFAIYENHIALIQSRALKSKDFESHLFWFLGNECSNVCDDPIFLIDQPKESARKKVERHPVKKVKIGTPLESEVQGDHSVDQEVEEDETIETMKAKRLWFRPKGVGFDILAAVLGDDWKRGLSLEESLDEANLKVNVEVTYLRKTSERSHKILNQVAQSLRHFDPEDTVIELDGGGTLKGNELKFSAPLSIRVVNGVPDRDSIFVEMGEWLRKLLSKGVV